MASENNKSMTTNHTNQHEQRQDKRKKFVMFVWFVVEILLVSILLISCKTLPKTLNMNLDTTDTLPFESGAFAYVFADVKKVRPIIDLLPFEELKNKEAKQMLDRTRFFVTALFPMMSGKYYQLAAQGNYPRSNAELAMSLNKGWQKKPSKSGADYWCSNGFSVLLTPSHAYVSMSQTNVPFDPFTPQPGVKIPEQFSEFRKGAPLACWIANPIILLNKIFVGLPVQSVKGFYFKLLPAAGKKYEVNIRLQFENPSHARALASILSLASGYSADSSLSVFLSNPPAVNGNNLDIKSNPLDDKEIKGLLEILL
jgi:hypothetical protein